MASRLRSTSTGLRDRGYENAHIWLPHDGTQSAARTRFHMGAGTFKAAGFSHVKVIGNQGKGAARQRIESGHRMFPSMWFNAATCRSGLEALGAYHERKDETRQIGLGPEHDWSSHAADAFGLMCMAYEPPSVKEAERPSVWTIDPEEQGTAWMGS